jgi:hypothetical protein
MTDSHMSGMIMHAMTIEETGVGFELARRTMSLPRYGRSSGTQRSTGPV